MAKKNCIVIVGGGFGGVYTALALEKLSADTSEMEVILNSVSGGTYSGAKGMEKG